MQERQQNLEQVQNTNELNAQLKTLMTNLKYRAPMSAAPTNKAVVNNYNYEDGVVKYTRHELDELMKQQQRGLATNDTGSGGYYDNLFFMFQIYVAFINALTNIANMSASMIFGNLTLQDAFSRFLVNVLNAVLKTNIADLTPEQLRDLLEKNRPIIQQISAIIIDEASQLLIGLSDVCSKIATDWMQNVVPGLVKSAAIGIPSAIEAAVPPLGEVVDIVNTALALMGSFMKVVDGVQRNADNISQGYGLVKNAYDSLQNIQRSLLGAATSAGLNQNLNYNLNYAQNNRVSPLQRGGGKKMKSRKYLKDPKKFKTYISKIRNKTAKKEVELINSIRELKNM
jgi:hypothetical protein